MNIRKGYPMDISCPGECFKETIAFEDILWWPNYTQRICTENATTCKKPIRFDFTTGTFDEGGNGGLLQQLGSTDPTSIAIIAGSSSAATLILVGIVIGIARLNTIHAV